MRSISIRRTLRHARPAFRARMRATCVIRRPIGEDVDANGKVVPIYDPTPVHDGPCYTRYPGLAFEQAPVIGGLQYAISRIVVRIPFGPVARPGDVVEILSDPDNPQLIGTRLRVASIDDQSQATAQRLLCEDHQQGVAP